MKAATFILYLMLAGAMSAGAQVYLFSDGKVSFFSEAPIENIDAHSTSLSSLLKPETNEIIFLVKLKTFQFKKALMQEHFNEKYMETDKYPSAAYKGKINEKIDWTKNGSYTVTSNGIFTLHGVSRQRTDTAQVTVNGGKITITSGFSVKLVDHNITIPKLVFENIAQVIAVKFSGEYHFAKTE